MRACFFIHLFFFFFVGSDGLLPACRSSSFFNRVVTVQPSSPSMRLAISVHVVYVSLHLSRRYTRVTTVGCCCSCCCRCCCCCCYCSCSSGSRRSHRYGGQQPTGVASTTRCTYCCVQYTVIIIITTIMVGSEDCH